MVGSKARQGMSGLQTFDDVAVESNGEQDGRTQPGEEGLLSSMPCSSTGVGVLGTDRDRPVRREAR